MREDGVRGRVHTGRERQFRIYSLRSHRIARQSRRCPPLLPPHRRNPLQPRAPRPVRDCLEMRIEKKGAFFRRYFGVISSTIKCAGRPSYNHFSIRRQSESVKKISSCRGKKTFRLTQIEKIRRDYFMLIPFICLLDASSHL